MSAHDPAPKHTDEAAALVAAIVAVAGALGLLGGHVSADQLALILGALMTLAAAARAWLARRPEGSAE